MTEALDLPPQLRASDPASNVFVSANAGSGKTTTLVWRVARLLLRGARPEAVLCVTYTKAAAAEMQTRLFNLLGAWSVLDDDRLAEELVKLGEDPRRRPVSEARALFARALETPGGLKIQTIHAFCEKLLRRFPLEAGVSPGFTVLEDSAAAEVSARARDRVAELALTDPGGAIGAAFAHFAIDLDYAAFEAMFGCFEARRDAITAYLEDHGAFGSHVWARLGFEEPVSPDDLAREAMAATDWAAWFRAAGALARGSEKTDQPFGLAMQALAESATRAGKPVIISVSPAQAGAQQSPMTIGVGTEEPWPGSRPSPGADWAPASAGETEKERDPVAFDAAIALFCTGKGEPKVKLATKDVDPETAAFLLREQERLCAARERMRAATIAADTVRALSLALTYVSAYTDEKTGRRALDFADLIARTRQLLTEKADAAWVLFKLDGGVDHILLDEAQDTAPEQWDIIRPLTEEFFAGAGASQVERTLFVVGDEKQSIYSFQGAAPERLKQEARFYRGLAGAAERPFHEVPLHDSWRSTPEILGFVDAVFAGPEAVEALTTDAKGPPIEHLSCRPDQTGCVDLWPAFQDEKRELEDAWDAPLDAAGPETARKQLARRIAEEIQRLTREGEAVGGRPADPGDVLILVRRRDALFEEIIRALKKARVPVAGADRLKLSDHIVFQDLVGLARFCLYPPDDLTLAALLRSPFCDVDEGGLYDLAQGRDGNLWAALARRGDERVAWAHARAFLGWARGEAGTRTPFDFYGRVMAHLDPEGRSMRQRLLTRLGREAEDALDEFLAQVQALELRGRYDLESVTAALAETEIQVKRELEAARGEVRVMTVHGAKGLEAPIVFLPDTTVAPQARHAPLLDDGEGGFLWAPRSAEDCHASRLLRERASARQAQESQRLLYVALTRARDRIVVCGRLASNRKGPDKGSWYERTALAFEAEAVAARTRLLTAADGLAFRRFGPDPATGAAARAAFAPLEALPRWTHGLAPAERTPRWASPAHIADGARASAPSPLSDRAGLGRFRRGALIHKLFEVLPEVAPAQRRAAALKLLAREPGLEPAQREEMIAAAFGVLDDPRFAAVFGEGSRAEASIAGTAPDLPPGVAVSGRLDRLVIGPDRVLVVDYKTNRPAPERAEDADPAYLAQIAVYVAVLRGLYPDRPVEAALVWTDGPRLTPVAPGLIEAALRRLREAGTT